jgi:hypothetical protein
MSKQVIIWIIVAAVVVLGGWYLWSQNSGTISPSPTTTDTTGDTSSADTATAPTGSGTGSLQSIFSRGGNYTCTFSTVSTAAGTGSNSSGTIYVANGKTRGDFSASTGSGTPIQVHVIRADGMNYNWVQGQTTGIKNAITTSSAIVPNPSGAGFSEDTLASVSWDCHAWYPDATQFVPPTSITFIEK